MEKLRTGTSLNFKRILDGLDSLKIEFLKPRSSFLCRWSFIQICLKSLSLVSQSLPDHSLINHLPQGIECSIGRKGQNELTSCVEPIDEPTDGLESIGTKKHDGEIAGDTIKGRQIRRQGAHVHTFEAKPWRLRTLNRPGASNLAGTEIDRQHFTGSTNLLSEIKGRDAVAGSDIEDSQARSKI